MLRKKNHHACSFSENILNQKQNAQIQCFYSDFFFLIQVGNYYSKYIRNAAVEKKMPHLFSYFGIELSNCSSSCFFMQAHSNILNVWLRNSNYLPQTEKIIYEKQLEDNYKSSIFLSLSQSTPSLLRFKAWGLLRGMNKLQNQKSSLSSDIYLYLWWLWENWP